MKLNHDVWGVIVMTLFASWVPVCIFINEYLSVAVALTAMYLIYEIEFPE